MFLEIEELISSSIELIENWDFLLVEKRIQEFLNKKVIPEIYGKIFEKALPKLKPILDQKWKELWYSWTRVRKTQLRIMSGVTIEIPTVYAQTGWKNNEWRNLSHEYLGIIRWCTPLFASNVVTTGLYAPSFQVASEILATRWIEVDDNKIASLTYKIAELWQKYRWKVSFKEWENFVWKTVIIGIDWWRIRTRKQKKWRKKKSWRSWFHAERRETKSIVISILDEKGNVEKKIRPFYDACIGTPKEFFEMMALYLVHWEIGNAKHVCVIADWAKRIWDGTQSKLLELWVLTENITEVLDYYHAVEHLGKFIEQLKTLTPKKKKKLVKQWKTLLRNWKVKELLSEMKKRCRWRNAWNMGKELRYFKKHKHRMSYAFFRNKWLICWSGIIESMIRRTTNLRLKWNWIFRTVPHAQKSLFLRSQLISWRRWVFIGNMLDLNSI